MAQKSQSRRRHIRYVPEHGTTARLQFPVRGKAFKPNYLGIVLTESQSGCSLVLALAPDVIKGDRLRIEVGALSPVLAEVRWAVLLDDQIQKIGVQYLDDRDD